ncbi:MAG: hypothetical protein ABJC09_06740, partial [Terriglobia bacterium]
VTSGPVYVETIAVLPWTYNTNANLIYIEKMNAVVGSAGQYVTDFRSDAHRNAANYTESIAADSLVTAFGNTMADTTAQATTQPLPQTLGGLSISIVDATGVERLAPLIYASPTQVVYQLPAGVSPGLALATIRAASGFRGTGLFIVSKVAPGLFSADGSGSGPAAAVAAIFDNAGLLSYALTATIDPDTNKPVPLPVGIAPPDRITVLELFGVGIRNFTSSATAHILRQDTPPADLTLPVQYAGPAPGFPGLDQINVVLPQSLAGAGTVGIQIVADGISSNPVQVQFK